ncbi:hypothetical protein QD460_18680 [Rhizobium jaguaris]
MQRPAIVEIGTGFDMQIACSEIEAKAWATDMEFISDPAKPAETPVL